VAAVTLQVHEIKNYLPEESASLATRISRAWSESLENLRLAGEGLLICAVAVGPWLVILALALTLMVLALRLLRRLRRAR
jgi:hypothetical protein